MIRVSYLMFSVLAVLSSCSRHEASKGKAEETYAPTVAIDACALLTKEEIQKIQGALVSSMTPSTSEGGAFIVSQCYIALPTAADSLNLTVLRRGRGNDARDPRELWERQFGEAAESERKREKEREGEKEGAKPEKIEGLGDEAYWVAQRFGGAVYALKGDNYLSLSVGGPGDRAAKLKSCKALAELAISRLQ